MTIKQLIAELLEHRADEEILDVNLSEGWVQLRVRDGCDSKYILGPGSNFARAASRARELFQSAEVDGFDAAIANAVARAIQNGSAASLALALRGHSCLPGTK